MGKNFETSRAINEILKFLVAGTAVGSAFIAPNTAQLSDKALKYLDRRDRRLRLEELLHYMKHKKLINYDELPGGKLSIKVTEQGITRAQNVRFDDMKIKKLKRWDKKWRLVMFDIPESHGRSRRALSTKLRELGFYQLQKSVWIHAYPCSTEVEIIKQVFGISKDNVVLAQISSIDSEELLLKHFKIRS